MSSSSLGSPLSSSNPDSSPPPQTMDPNHVFVGICIRDTPRPNENNHTDVSNAEPPTIIKCHGTAGFVKSVGSSVTELQPGDLVAIDFLNPCMECMHCKSREYICCTERNDIFTQAYQNTPPTFSFPKEMCIKLEGNLVYDGAFVEPLAIAINLLRESHAKSDKSLIVFGANFIGILCCILARLEYKVTNIMIVGVDKKGLEVASEITHAETFQMSYGNKWAENVAGIARRFTIAINAAGDHGFFDTATNVVQEDGIYVQAGMIPSGTTFEVFELFGNGFDCKGNIGYAPGDFKKAVDFLTNNLETFRELKHAIDAHNEAGGA